MDINKSSLREKDMELTREEEKEARGRRHNGVARNEVGHEGAPEVDISIGEREGEEENENAVEEGARGGRQANHPVGDHLVQEDLQQGGRSDKGRDQQARSDSPNCLVSRTLNCQDVAGKRAGVSRDAAHAGLKWA
jgi:hypothetical protein